MAVKRLTLVGLVLETTWRTEYIRIAFILDRTWSQLSSNSNLVATETVCDFDDRKQVFSACDLSTIGQTNR